MSELTKGFGVYSLPNSSIRGLEMTEKVIQRAEALLAKLEGGAEDAVETQS